MGDRSGSPTTGSAAVAVASSGKKAKGAAAVDHICETCSKVNHLFPRITIVAVP